MCLRSDLPSEAIELCEACERCFANFLSGVCRKGASLLVGSSVVSVQPNSNLDVPCLFCAFLRVSVDRRIADIAETRMDVQLRLEKSDDAVHLLSIVKSGLSIFESTRGKMQIFTAADGSFPCCCPDYC